ATPQPNYPGLLCRVAPGTALDERLGDCRRISIGGQFFRGRRVDYGLWHPRLVVSRWLYPGFLSLLVFVAAPLRRSGAYTIPDLMSLRFPSRALRRLTAIIVVF